MLQLCWRQRVSSTFCALTMDSHGPNHIVLQWQVKLETPHGDIGIYLLMFGLDLW